MNNRPIGIFDSGLGGLTVVKALKKILPNERILYFGDTARLPYGVKSEDLIIQYSMQIARFLIKNDAKMIIIACNTATAMALEVLKNNFEGTPIIGVIEPGSVQASLDSKNKNNMISLKGYIPQNYNFLDDTILKNIAFGEAEVDMEKVRNSLKQANLLDFVESLNNKYEERIGEQGILLSGGQKQRLAIARSLYLDAQILILDESTSSLDQDTEAKIIEEFMKLKNSITLVVISHKMLNYTYFDKIISIKNKKIEIKKNN